MYALAGICTNTSLELVYPLLEYSVRADSQKLEQNLDHNRIIKGQTLTDEGNNIAIELHKFFSHRTKNNHQNMVHKPRIKKKSSSMHYKSISICNAQTCNSQGNLVIGI